SASSRPGGKSCTRRSDDRRAARPDHRRLPGRRDPRRPGPGRTRAPARPAAEGLAPVKRARRIRIPALPLWAKVAGYSVAAFLAAPVVLRLYARWWDLVHGQLGSFCEAWLPMVQP